MPGNFTVQERLHGKLVVSCQAAPGDPLEDTETIRRIARAVSAAGAGGLRINSPEHIAAIRKDTDLPIIGIQKRYVDGMLRITPDFASAAAVAKAGASIIALDCTERAWAFGEPWRQLIQRIHSELKLPVMADVATLSEAVAAAEAGADFAGTTLNGYTEETRHIHSFNWPLLAEMVRQTRIPIIAEGHISTPAEARRAVAEGAWCVVVGSAITRPGMIAAGFVRALRPAAEGAPAIGVDIGGTSIKAGVVSRTGEVSLTTQVPTEAARGRDAIASGLATAIEQSLDQAKGRGFEPCGLGIATGGVIDAGDGSIFAATDNLPGWAGFPLCEFVEQRFHLPAYAVNDAHAAALAELHFGLGRNLSDFVAITIGTGIGGGIVSGGKLLQGRRGFAGTIGHQAIRGDGRLCNCGRRGCLEAYVSTASLLREYAGQAGKTIDPALTEAALARQISQLALAGDPAAQAAYGVLAGYLAEGLANIFNLLDPEAVFVSGGLVEGHREFAADVERRVQHLLHFGAKRFPRVLLSSQGYYAGVQGAGALVFSMLPL
ncbi:MAG: putative N-acetylmannosamine-6-phosphate 2-epimerase [Acidobacteriota bacterium]|nr:putative N-acetylmannosamine-6-phosphate 2-epimerase [Acidobacteriota bacterium]